VAAVIALITTVNGFSGSLSSSFSAMGAGTLTVSVTGSDLKSGLTAQDLEALAALDIVDGVTPSVSLSARVSRGGSYETGISVSGKNAYYFRQNAELVKRGRTINHTDEDSTTFVCLISDDMVETFFYGEDPIGRDLYIGGIPFLVVGLLDADSGTSIADMLSGLAIGHEIVLTGTRTITKEGGGQICLDTCEIVSNAYGSNKYSTESFITDKTIEDITKHTDSPAETVKVYVVTGEIEVQGEQYATKYFVSDGTNKFLLYSGSPGQYAWLAEYAGQELTIEVAVCDWNAKGLKGCVLSITTADGTQIFNEYNFG